MGQCGHSQCRSRGTGAAFFCMVTKVVLKGVSYLNALFSNSEAIPCPMSRYFSEDPWRSPRAPTPTLTVTHRRSQDFCLWGPSDRRHPAFHQSCTIMFEAATGRRGSVSALAVTVSLVIATKYRCNYIWGGFL